ERARDRHRQEVVAPDADSAVAGTLGVEAHRADAVPERRPAEHGSVDDQSGDAEQDPRVEALQQRVAPEDRELRALDDVVRDRNRRLRLVLERATNAETE